MMVRTYFIIFLFAISLYGATAQEKALVKKGNNFYLKKDYKDASQAYMEALKKNPANTLAMNNLGAALYQQKQFDAARQALNATIKTAPQKEIKANAAYNMGDTYLAEKKYEDAINAYKQSLRNNPQDADAKYNLSYALAMMKKNGGGGGKNKDKQNKDNKSDQKKDNKDQQKNNSGDNKDKDKQDKGDQSNQKNDNAKQDDQQQNQRPQAQPSKLSQQQADQLLDALEREENKVHDKMKQQSGTPVKLDKDW